MKKALFFIFVFFLIFSVSEAGEINSSDRLRGLARSLWSAVELQGLSDTELTLEQQREHVQQSVIWLETAHRLSENDKYVLSDLEYLYRSEMINDPGRAMDALKSYSNLAPEDNLCVSGWMNYCLDMLNTQLARSNYINSMLENLMEYPKVQSDMITLLGTYSLEQGEVDRAASTFEYAWKLWPYNIDAGARLISLPQPEPDAQNANLSETQLEQMKNQLAENSMFQRFYFLVVLLTCDPGKANVSLELAEMLYSLDRFSDSVIFYDHFLKLLKDDTEQDYTGIKLKAAVCYYISQDYDSVIGITDEILATYPQDIPSAAFKILAMKSKGLATEADIFASNFEKLLVQQQLSQEQESLRKLELLWYYVFAKNDLERALPIADSIGPDSEGIMPEILGYFRAVSGKVTDHEKFLEQFPPESALNCFALAHLSEQAGNIQQAYKYILQAKEFSPGVLYSFINEYSVALRQKGNIPEPEVSTNAIDAILRQFNRASLEMVFNPEKFVRCNVTAARKMVEYTDEIPIDILLTNVSSSEIAVGPQMFIDPHVLLSAEVSRIIPGAEKDVVRIPLGLRYLSQRPLLRPGFSNSFREIVNYGELGDFLDSSPQVDCEIKFFSTIMPYIDDKGKIVSMRPQLAQPALVVRRQAVVLTAQRVTLNYKLLLDGQPDEKVNAVRLFTGLLKEARLANAGELPYKPRVLDYDRTILAVLANLKDSDPLVRAWTAYHLSGLLDDKQVVDALSGLIRDNNWFVRLMVLNALKQSVKIDTVLDWFIKNETDETVLRQVQLWLDQPWQTKPLPFDFPTEE